MEEGDEHTGVPAATATTSGTTALFRYITRRSSSARPGAARERSMRGAAHLLTMALVFAGLFAAAAQAQDYPNRPGRILVGFAPGSVADLSARVLASRLGQVLGQQFVVENKTGAGSAVAAGAGAPAPKDGYTLFLGSSATLTNQLIAANPAFDMTKDFAPIALVTEVKVVLVVHPSTGVKSVKELIALAKAKDGGLLYASVGPGSAPHLA